MYCEWILYVISILIQLNGHHNLVEARHAVVPMGTYSHSQEGIHLKNAYEATIQPDYYENDRAEYFYRQQKRHKKAKKSKKLKTRRPKLEKDRSHEHPEEKVHKKRFKPKRKYVKKFVKTSLKGIDSNLSGSKELLKGKPVDIIVHIKMND